MEYFELQFEIEIIIPEDRAMRKNFLIMILIILLFPALCFSINFSAGIKIGPTLNHFHGDDWDDMVNSTSEPNDRFKLGFSVGAFLTIDILEFISIQPEFYFSIMGGALDYTENSLSGELKYSFMVLEIPVLAKGNFTTERLRASLFAGPNFIITVGQAKMDLEIGGSKVYDWYEFPESILRKFIMGIVVGGSLDTKISENTFIIIDVRYVLTFTDIIDDNQFIYFPASTRYALEPDLMGNSLKFMIGFGIEM